MLVRRLLERVVETGRDLVRHARRPFLPARRLDVCCCGLSKTGTHSMAGIFASYRSAHHPDAHTRLDLAIRYLQGTVDPAVAEETLKRRDRLLHLEMESSALAGILIEPFVRACPGKKFLLTIRDPFTWCDSWLDHNINSPPDPRAPFARLDRVRLRVDDFAPTAHDAPLLQRGFPSLACYFQLWASHNAQVLRTVPAERLLIVRTEELSDRLPDIAAWAGIPAQTLRMDRSRLFVAPKKHGLLATLDPSYVRETAERFCAPLIERHPALGLTLRSSRAADAPSARAAGTLSPAGSVVSR
jgi:hypothetical protein